MRRLRWLAAAGLVLLGGCKLLGWPPPVQPEPTTVVVVADPCLLSPPPTLAKVEAAGPDGGCPPPFAICLPLDDARALVANSFDLVAYASRAWALCGPRDGGIGDGGVNVIDSGQGVSER